MDISGMHLAGVWLFHGDLKAVRGAYVKLQGASLAGHGRGTEGTGIEGTK